MLWLIEVVGRIVLVVVLLTPAAWTATTDNARRTRLGAGSFTIGVSLGILALIYLPGSLSFFFDPSWKLWIALVGIPLLLMVITFVLESVRRRFVE